MFEKTYTFNEFFNNCKKKESKIKQVKNKNDKQLIIKNNNVQNNQLSFKDKIQDTKIKFKQYSKLKIEISKLVDDWKEIMINTKCYNEGNLTLTLSHIKKEELFGWSCRIYSPFGTPLEKLEILTLSIESGLKCKFIYDIPEHKQFAMAKIIYLNKVNHNLIPFKPVKVKPYELYTGIDITGKKIILNVNYTPHVLLAGQTRKGKNGSLDHMLTSLIWSCNSKEIELYLFQCAKNDLIKYSKCKQVKCFSLCDFKKMEKALEYLLKEIDHRLKLMESMIENLQGDNLYDYNKLNPNNKLPYTYAVIDEFMVLMLPTKDKKDTKVKQHILSMLEKIGEMGGAVGITYIVAHQKPEKALCPTFIKNMSLIRICFGFDDESCGRIVLGEKYGDLALKLPARRAYYSADGKIDLMFTTNLRNFDGSSRIKEFIKDSIEPNHKTIFDEFEEEINKNISKKKSNKVKQVGNGVIEVNPSKIKLSKDDAKTAAKDKEKIIHKNIKEVQLNFDKVDPNIIQKKDEKTKINISKIPNFVPYNPNENLKVIDETKLDLTKTQKPVKKGCVILNVNENLHN